jgi:hypothetical protein
MQCKKQSDANVMEIGCVTVGIAVQTDKDLQSSCDTYSTRAQYPITPSKCVDGDAKKECVYNLTQHMSVVPSPKQF